MLDAGGRLALLLHRGFAEKSAALCLCAPGLLYPVRGDSMYQIKLSQSCLKFFRSFLKFSSKLSQSCLRVVSKLTKVHI